MYDKVVSGRSTVDAHCERAALGERDVRRAAVEGERRLAARSVLRERDGGGRVAAEGGEVEVFYDRLLAHVCDGRRRGVVPEDDRRRG